MKIPNVTIQQLLEAGVHLGHKTLRWNPKMKKYIFGKRDSIHIIDLTQTLELIKVALEKVHATIANNGKILFVSTKKQASEAIAELSKETDQYFVVVEGGHYGQGNTRFKSSTNRAPKKFGKGKPGDFRQLFLELKLLADVGIIGFPNAGKSTLISRISNARPKVAGYPFTTLVPNLGIVKLEEGESFVAADIPGLIENASKEMNLSWMQKLLMLNLTLWE